MHNNKSRIDTYKTIYNVDLVVANKYSSIEELNKLYKTVNDDDITEDFFDSIATTVNCRNRETNAYVILVRYNHDSTDKTVDKKIDFINTISHEAGHVVLDIYTKIEQQVCTCSSEMFCYLLGWVSECIYKTLTAK